MFKIFVCFVIFRLFRVSLHSLTENYDEIKIIDFYCFIYLHFSGDRCLQA